MRKGTKRKAPSRKDGAAKSKPEEAENEASKATVEENNKEEVVEKSQSAAAAAEEEESSKVEQTEENNKSEPSTKLAEEENEEKEKEEQSTKPVEEKKKGKEKVEPSKAVKRRGKRARITKQEDEPEYFEEKRNLEDLWKQVFPVGTEWEQLDLVYQYKWSFQNLEDAFEEGGELHGKKVYLFGCTEPQFVSFQGQQKLVVIPVVVAVVSPFPPSDKIGITSVQRESEEILPMKQMKMDWIPYIPFANRDSQVERLKSQIFILACTQRRAGLKHLKIDRVKKFEYCLPYFYQPLREDEFENKTDVDILFPDTEPPIVCEFDWELDELEEFTDKFIEEDQLPADKKDAFKEFVKEKVREAKKANREAREARRKAIEEMSDETKAAFESMKFYKFYPVTTPDSPDVSSVKAPFINRYYGKAHNVL
ncbi:protein HEAT INTOLERANT 4-like [Coffea arabica]|uniref:Protein HEAT INTOLERANT 4-like n=1 Tax=Coffea arabica TaxID=13443 RepID=A0ABM4V3Q5_COFAR